MILGYPEGGELRQLRDRYARLAPLPPDGIVLTDVLAQILHLEPGDRVAVEVHEGKRENFSIVVAGTVDEAFGLQGHMTADSLSRRGASRIQTSSWRTLRQPDWLALPTANAPGCSRLRGSGR